MLSHDERASSSCPRDRRSILALRRLAFLLIALRPLPRGNVTDILQFHESISARSMVELSLKGRQFTTWSNMQDNPLLE